ncbi:hypothetical protein F896_01110 [Acinetobacter genomosp. 15BJ]|uniref:HTH asnC-type domain-containing protein n=1 Tax=Acinetobacter genomosp. 15BJ TaxID=106651 RepID=R9B4A7_9GAMM|nr:hypothetical protein F896_01110 [Acinetobacter genomosp. 15BJ]
MDKFDWQIIQALQKNGRLTNQEVGDLIGLSASQCSRRRQLLEQKGVILGYAARIHQQALGLEVTAMIHINLRIHEAKSQQAFQDLIEAEDNIQDAFSISGDADFILKVVAENLEQLSQFVIRATTVLWFYWPYKILHCVKKNQRTESLSQQIQGPQLPSSHLNPILSSLMHKNKKADIRSALKI